MKVILTKRVANLGNEWDVVSVKDGYARNFLIPQGIANVATPALIKKAETHIANRAKRLEELLANAQANAKKLEEVTLSFTEKTQGDKLYGSITEKDIVDSLFANNKIEINKEMVVMKEHLKTIGEHKVTIRLTEDVTAEITVNISAE